MELNELLEKVKSALSEEKYDEVINFLSNDILHDRNNAELYCYRGFAWIRKRAYGEAIADFTQSIELNPEYVEAYYGRGNAQSENGNYAGAIADYTIITKLDKDDARAYYNRGINQYKIRNYDKAIADYTRAIALNLKTPGVYNNRGVAWDDRGDHRKAITDYNKAIKLNPKYANAYVNRGIVWDNKGDLDKAIYDYTTAIKINRKFAHAYYNRSIAMLERSATGDYLRAINDISNSIEFGYGEMTPFRMFCDDLNRIKRFIKSAQLKKMIEFSKHSENNIDEIKNHAKNNYSGMVVHYTKLSVVDVLVTSQYSKDTRMGGSYFHFYNAVYMNDPEEGKTVFRILNNINKSRMEGISKAFDNGKKEDPSSVYIGSFLPQVNHEDELIMWRTYGKDEEQKEACGCNISLSADFFDQHGKSMFPLRRSFAHDHSNNLQLLNPETVSKPNQALYTVIYYNKKEHRIMAEHASVMIKHFEELSENLSGLIKVGKGHKNLQKIINRFVFRVISELQYLFKSSDYAYEKELRMIQFEPPASDRVLLDENGTLPKRLYVESNKDVRQYLKRIRLGPKVAKPGQWIYLDEMMKKQGYIDFTLAQSECKFQ